MKRLFSLVLLAALLLTGCTSHAALSPANPVTLTLWHVYGEQAAAPMNPLVEQFNATVGQEKGITIVVTNVTSSSKISGQLKDARDGVPGAPEMPDLFSCHTNTARQLGTENLVDFGEYFDDEALKSYVPEFVQDGTMDGKFCVFPVSKSTYALFINGSQFMRFSADTGVTYEDLDTWEGFFAAAEKYYDWSGGTTFCAMDYLIRHIELDVLAGGNELHYTENGWYDTQDAALRESVMKFARALVQGHIAVSDRYANTQVMTGEALCGIGSTAAIAYYNDQVTYADNTVEPTNLKVLPLPKTGSGQQYMPQTGVGLAAWFTTPQKAQAAAEFVRWFTQSARNLDFVAQTGYMPVNNESFDAISTYSFASPAYAGLYEAIAAMRKTYTPVVRPDFADYYDRVDALYEGLRERQTEYRARSNAGEDLQTLCEAFYEFFSLQ